MRLLAGFTGALHTDGYSGYGPAVREYDLVPLHSDFDRLRRRRRGRNGAQMIDFQTIITSVQRY